MINLSNSLIKPEQHIIFITSLILGLGLVMVASSSMAIAEARAGDPFFYVYKQAIYLGLGLVISWFVYRTPTQFWLFAARPLLLFSLLLLGILLVPGIGSEVNGSMRWIRVGPVSLQVSELAKLCLIIYLAYYLSQNKASLKALLPIGMACGLILLQPDLGASTVIMACALGMLFMAGLPIWQFLLLCALAGGAFAGLAISAPYRMQRLTAFLNPWADQFDSGYQLTQALMAVGRGEWFGVGLGAGVQKLLYLPEAYTDFIFAVTAEELGLFGATTVLVLYALLAWQGLRIALYAQQKKALFQSYLAYGISLWLIIQAIIAMGVNIGLLPTKGLTLPLFSYGGSSLVVSMIAVALLLRIDREV